MGGGTHPPHWRNTEGAGFPAPTPCFDAYGFLKTLSHRLVRSQYCGIVWAKEEGFWGDLEICVAGGAETPFRTPPWKRGGASAPLPPLFLRLCCIVRRAQGQVTAETGTCGSVDGESSVAGEAGMLLNDIHFRITYEEG